MMMNFGRFFGMSDEVASIVSAYFSAEMLKEKSEADVTRLNRRINTVEAALAEAVSKVAAASDDEAVTLREEETALRVELRHLQASKASASAEIKTCNADMGYLRPDIEAEVTRLCSGVHPGQGEVLEGFYNDRGNVRRVLRLVTAATAERSAELLPYAVDGGAESPFRYNGDELSLVCRLFNRLGAVTVGATVDANGRVTLKKGVNAYKEAREVLEELLGKWSMPVKLEGFKGLKLKLTGEDVNALLLTFVTKVEATKDKSGYTGELSYKTAISVSGKSGYQTAKFRQTWREILLSKVMVKVQGN